MLSQLNGTLDAFKDDRTDQVVLWEFGFDRITDGRRVPVTNAVQKQLFESCQSSEQVVALMIYLVERCRLPVARIRREIKSVHQRIAFDLRRSEASMFV
jgi:hypothetical protein